MAPKNGVGTMEELEEVMAEEPFDPDDLPLPVAYLTEVMARTALEHLKTIQVLRVNIAGNKGAHNDAEVTRLAQAEMASRFAVSAIKRQYPAALGRVSALAQYEADQAKAIGAS